MLLIPDVCRQVQFYISHCTGGQWFIWKHQITSVSPLLSCLLSMCARGTVIRYGTPPSCFACPLESPFPLLSLTGAYRSVRGVQSCAYIAKYSDLTRLRLVFMLSGVLRVGASSIPVSFCGPPPSHTTAYFIFVITPGSSQFF